MSGNAAPILPGLEEAVEGDVTVEGTAKRVRTIRGAWQAVEVEVERRGRLVIDTWVGEFGPVAPGQRVRGVGRYEKHPEYGEQFRTSLVVVIAPTERAAIIEYLGSAIEGVGPAIARALVDHFGEAVLDVLDTHPERVEEVPGIGPERAASVARGWHLAQATNRVTIFLQSHGASPALAAKIVRYYQGKGIDPLAVVSQEPYRLALEVHGIGFATADVLAKNLGVGADSPERAQAGALHVLGEVGSRGHTYVDLDEITSRTATLLGRQTPEGRAAIRCAVEELGRSKRVVIEPYDGSEETLFGPERVRRSAVYAPHVYEAEWVVAARIAALASSLGRGRGDRSDRLVEHADAACEAFEEEAKIQLAPEQRAAVLAVATYPVVVITGSPGTGKTSVTRAILMFCARAGFRVKLAAPTGRAAKRLADLGGDPAQTIHRLLGMQPGRPPEFNAKHPLDADVVLADESSMMDLSLTRSLLEAVADGTRVVFVGDRDQLPSVQPGAVLRDLIASGAVPVIRLERIFRQGPGSTISQAARQILRGRVPESDEGPDGEFFIVEKDDPDAAVATIERLVAERIPETFGIQPKDIAVLVPQHKGPGGTLVLNSRLQALLNPKGRELRRAGRIFRVGDRVLQLRNDYEREIYNGDMGTVIEGRPHDAELVVDFDGRHVVLDDEALEDLTLAYAMSVHKVQGDQRPAVVLYIGEHHAHMLARTLFYTAVTRGQRLVVVVGPRRALGMAVREQRRDVRRTRLADRLGAMMAKGDGREGRGGMNVPANHRQAERLLIVMVTSGEWEIDDRGHIWRLKCRGGRGRCGSGTRVVDVHRRRAEKLLPSGYLMVRAMLDGKRITGLAHRLVWQHFNGDIPDGLIINHKNGRKDDNRPENLEVTDYRGNAIHCHENLNPVVLRGSHNGAAKLSESDVIDMRNARAGGASLLALSARFGISYQQVSTITRGRRWKHVRGAPLQVQDGRAICRQKRSTSGGRFIGRGS